MLYRQLLLKSSVGAEVISTDRQEVLDLLQLNANLNTDSSIHKIKVAELNWYLSLLAFAPLPPASLTYPPPFYNKRASVATVNLIIVLPPGERM